MADYNRAFELTMNNEGWNKYVNHPSDPGGPTRYGISEAVARKHGYAGDMREFPLELAQRIGKSDYWDVLHLDEIDDQDVAFEIFDTSFNMGPIVSALILQSAVNIFHGCINRSSIMPDGIIGPKTIQAINDITKRWSKQFYNCLNGEQYERYKYIKDKYPKAKAFFIGWMNRV